MPVLVFDADGVHVSTADRPEDVVRPLPKGWRTERVDAVPAAPPAPPTARDRLREALDAGASGDELLRAVARALL